LRTLSASRHNYSVVTTLLCNYSNSSNNPFILLCSYWYLWLLSELSFSFVFISYYNSSKSFWNYIFWFVRNSILLTISCCSSRIWKLSPYCSCILYCNISISSFNRRIDSSLSALISLNYWDSIFNSSFCSNNSSLVYYN